MSNILDLIVNGDQYLKTSKSIGHNKHFETADDTVYICPTCKYAWEKPKRNCKKMYRSYGIVPSYGKRRKICFVCRVKIKRKNKIKEFTNEQ